MQVELKERDDPRVTHILATGIVLHPRQIVPEGTPMHGHGDLDGIVAQVPCVVRNVFHPAMGASESPRAPATCRHKAAPLPEVASGPGAVRASMPAP